MVPHGVQPEHTPKTTLQPLGCRIPTAKSNSLSLKKTSMLLLLSKKYVHSSLASLRRGDWGTVMTLFCSVAHSCLLPSLLHLPWMWSCSLLPSSYGLLCQVSHLQPLTYSWDSQYCLLHSCVLIPEFLKGRCLPKHRSSSQYSVIPGHLRTFHNILLVPNLCKGLPPALTSVCPTTISVFCLGTMNLCLQSSHSLLLKETTLGIVTWVFPVSTPPCWGNTMPQTLLHGLAQHQLCSNPVDPHDIGLTLAFVL